MHRYVLHAQKPRQCSRWGPLVGTLLLRIKTSIQAVSSGAARSPRSSVRSPRCGRFGTRTHVRIRRWYMYEYDFGVWWEHDIMVLGYADGATGVVRVYQRLGAPVC